MSASPSLSYKPTLRGVLANKMETKTVAAEKRMLFFLGFVRPPLLTINHNDMLYSASLVKSARCTYIRLSVDFNPFCIIDFKTQNFFGTLVSPWVLPFLSKVSSSKPCGGSGL